MNGEKDSLKEFLGVIISFGFITGLSLGFGVKIPSEGDVLLMVYDTLNQSFSSNALGNSQFIGGISFSEYGSFLKFMVLVLEIIPIIFAILLLPWGPVLLIDSIIAGYSLGLFASNQNQTLMWIGVVALILISVFTGLTIESKKKHHESEYGNY
jgi:hypothetical protein